MHDLVKKKNEKKIISNLLTHLQANVVRSYFRDTCFYIRKRNY